MQASRATRGVRDSFGLNVTSRSITFFVMLVMLTGMYFTLERGK